VPGIFDGTYLASGAQDSIRLWHIESFRTTSSKTSKERHSQAPAQAHKILRSPDHYTGDFVVALSFSRTDSNLLASAGLLSGEIKLWNVKDQACIHTFHTRPGIAIKSLFFAGGDNSSCDAVTEAGSFDRRLWRWRAEDSSNFTRSETILDTPSHEPELGGQRDVYNVGAAAFSSCRSFVLTTDISFSRVEDETTIALFEPETRIKHQSIVISAGFDVSCFDLSPIANS
jgi:WD40 repeat protein